MNAILWTKLTVNQRARCCDLLRELRAIRHEALHSPASSERVLASPRSSLDPRFLLGASEVLD